MLYARSTEHHLGMTLYGDFNDFENLLHALYDVVGDEGEYEGYHLASIRILGFCFDLRHAIMGDRDYELEIVGPAIDQLDNVPANNLYLKFNVLWPEMIFISFVLNDFIDLMKVRKKILDWDQAIIHSRNLQAAITNCLQGILSQTAFKKYLKGLQQNPLHFKNYITQYIDELNVEYTYERLKLRKLGGIIEKIYKYNNDYQETKKSIIEYANENNIPIEHVNLDLNFPNEINW